MKNNILFKGIYSALFSVYDKNLNVIDKTVSKMINYQLNNGIDGFYVCGGTGECIVLPEKTRRQMLESTIEHNNGRGKIIAHVGAGHIDETINLVHHANTQKIDAIASLPPSLTTYYSKNEAIEYYKLLAKESTTPVIAYITPAVLHYDIKTFAEELMKIPNVIGIKLTIPDYYAHSKVANVNGGNINLLNGPDESMICGLAMGCQGAIGTTYNIAPKIACNIYNNMQKGNIKEAQKNQYFLNSIINIGLGHNIDHWKEFMRLMGFDMGVTIFPGKPTTKAESDQLKDKLNEINFFSKVEQEFI